MTVTTQTHDDVAITETRMSYAECEKRYGTSNMAELNRKFIAKAKQATDGNCDQWAIYANGGITVVTEC